MTIQWSAEMDATLRTMRADGAGYHPIGDVVGVTSTAVKRRVIALDLPVWSKGGGRRQRGVRERRHETMEKKHNLKTENTSWQA